MHPNITTDTSFPKYQLKILDILFMKSLDLLHEKCQMQTFNVRVTGKTIALRALMVISKVRIRKLETLELANLCTHMHSALSHFCNAEWCDAPLSHCWQSGEPRMLHASPWVWVHNSHVGAFLCRWTLDRARVSYRKALNTPGIDSARASYTHVQHLKSCHVSALCFAHPHFFDGTCTLHGVTACVAILSRLQNKLWVKSSRHRCRGSSPILSFHRCFLRALPPPGGAKLPIFHQWLFPTALRCKTTLRNFLNWLDLGNSPPISIWEFPEICTTVQIKL